MSNLRSKIGAVVFTAALALAPCAFAGTASPSGDNILADRGGGGGHGGGGHGGGGGHHGGGGGGGHHGGGNWNHGGGNWNHGGNWHHGGNWDHGWHDDGFYGFGFYGWPYGYDGYQNASNCYYYQATDGNWYYTCGSY